MKPVFQLRWEHLAAAAIGGWVWWMLIKLTF